MSYESWTAIAFNGTNQFADVDTEFNQFSGGTRYATISLWFWPSSGRAAAANVVFHQKFSGQAPWLYVAIDPSEQIDVIVRGIAGDTSRTLLNQGTFVEDAWNRLIIQIDSTDDTVDIWLNESKIADGAALSGAITAFDGLDVPFGQRFGGNLTDADDYTGYLRMMGLAGGTTAITQADADAFQVNPASHLATWGYVAYWYGDEGTGTAVDNAESTAARDLTLTAGTMWIAPTTVENIPASDQDSHLGEFHGELVTDGDSSGLTALYLYRNTSNVAISALGANQKVCITDVTILGESGGDFALVADSAAAGKYIVYGLLPVTGVYRHAFRTPYVCPAGVIPKFRGVAANRNVCLIQGFIRAM